ncbi:MULTISPECIES: benenodin family lasso peptide [unclassified Rhodanobacter]|nr:MULTISPECIES: benenodin family lasso peptide [unclassified Rhodanobacter]
MSSKREDTLHNDASDEEIVMLGVASTDTQGGPLSGEEMGGFTALGIAQD